MGTPPADARGRTSGWRARAGFSQPCLFARRPARGGRRENAQRSLSLHGVHFRRRAGAGHIIGGHAGAVRYLVAGWQLAGIHRPTEKRRETIKGAARQRRRGGGSGAVLRVRGAGVIPTGEWIATNPRADRLVLVTPDGKTTRDLPGDGGPVAWSHDGKTLYQIRENTPALAAIDVASGRNASCAICLAWSRILSAAPGLSAALTFDQKSILYTVNRPRTEI